MVYIIIEICIYQFSKKKQAYDAKPVIYFVKTKFETEDLIGRQTVK